MCRPRIIRHVIRHSLHLMQDAYGNYVVQYVVEKGEKQEAEAVMRLLLGNIPRLSQQKYSSNVVEKCLEVASDPLKQKLVAEIAAAQTIKQLLYHQYANYVVQVRAALHPALWPSGHSHGAHCCAVRRVVKCHDAPPGEKTPSRSYPPERPKCRKFSSEITMLAVPLISLR